MVSSGPPLPDVQIGHWTGAPALYRAMRWTCFSLLALLVIAALALVRNPMLAAVPLAFAILPAAFLLRVRPIDSIALTTHELVVSGRPGRWVFVNSELASASPFLNFGVALRTTDQKTHLFFGLYPEQCREVSNAFTSRFR